VHKISFDTNLLLRWILRDVPDKTEQVVACLKNPEVKEVHVADLALAEVVWILSSPRMGYARADVAELLQIILKYPKVRYNERLLDKVLPFYVKHPAVSFADACLAGYADLQDAYLLTFDKKLARQHDHARLLARADR
jgi:predicted nucleic-acid-binding protein